MSLRLNECQVEAYVVMDGAYDKSDIKLRTTIKRATDQTRSAIYVRLDRPNKTNVMPLFAKGTF